MRINDRVPFPASVTVFISVWIIYAAQLLIAGSSADGAAARAVYMLPDGGFLALNPWMHSDHLHIFQNAVIFAGLGWWAEQQIGTKRFSIAVIAAGYLTNLVPLFIGFGGHTVGISGITNMLWTLLALTLIVNFFNEISDPTTSDMKPIGHLIFAFGIFGMFVWPSIAQFFGYMAAQNGAAKGAHFLGVVLGVVWYVLRHYESRVDSSLEQQPH